MYHVRCVAPLSASHTWRRAEGGPVIALHAKTLGGSYSVTSQEDAPVCPEYLPTCSKVVPTSTRLLERSDTLRRPDIHSGQHSGLVA